MTPARESRAPALDPVNGDLFGSCPVPRTDHDHIVLGHGSGGRLTADLIQGVFLPGFGNEVLAALEDQATISLGGSNGTRAPRIALTTDSFVVRPLFFPGGDIGTLAVHGTVHDLAVGGALPRFLAAAFILEEGLALDGRTRALLARTEGMARTAPGLHGTFRPVESAPKEVTPG